MKTFYTQEFLEYMALSMSTMTAVFSKGNIDGCTITDNIVLGPYATRSGKKQKVKTSASENLCTFSSTKDTTKTTNHLWDFSVSPDYNTTTEYFYQAAPSLGLSRRLFESVFNTNTSFIAIPFETTNDFPNSISDDYGGSTTSLYWENQNFWSYTVASPTIISGTSIQLYVNETLPDFQCTIPSFILGYNKGDNVDVEYEKPFGGYILASDSAIKDDNIKLIIYAGLLDKEIAVWSNTSVFQTVINMDVVII